MMHLGDRVCFEDVERRVKSLRATDEAQWGVMRVGEMVRHVDGAFRMALGEEPVARVASPLPRGLVKWIALWSPLRWPHGLPTVPELRRGEQRVRVGEFAADHAVLLEGLQRFGRLRELQTDHPIFGRMRTRDWMRWGWLHTDHHLRQFGR